MTELLGGEDRIDPKSAVWNDSFIVNLGTEALSGPDVHIDPKDLDNWHVDGELILSSMPNDVHSSLILQAISS